MEKNIEAEIRAEIQNVEARRVASNRAFDLELADLQTALRVIQGIGPKKAAYTTTIFSSAVKAHPDGVTNKDAILRSLHAFGPLSTADLLLKVNTYRVAPTTLGTVRVTASQLKTKGHLGYDGKNWTLKQIERQPN